MTKHKHLSRKTNRVVRMPATKFPKLRKQLKKDLPRLTPKPHKDRYFP